ncbi:hypothetical protein MQE36_14425 [Zhouia spongiae]|uniref:Uncharacterized protein n=1 Tax=Zhouia spongiae TaxID=2202721 RepID=A0ABY3YL03_9FLAO|nr:hypothetical protein [Zhouia spongiae]UNY98274.1 hypothetical protein MQE36_14425 [Zhouia spongiae]
MSYFQFLLSIRHPVTIPEKGNNALYRNFVSSGSIKFRNRPPQENLKIFRFIPVTVGTETFLNPGCRVKTNQTDLNQGYLNRVT